MNIVSGNYCFVRFYIILILLGYSFGSIAQTRKLVWADEFNDPVINRSLWSFDKGPANDCVHYFTDRPENARIENGLLRIIALRESYEGFNYTAALLKTKNAMYWRYGRIEARIKLPATNGFVPAFWMMPEDDLYGWWPKSGEIDIMEHPTNQVDKIYGTVHYGTYNPATGSGAQGGQIQVPDAETAFHLYAIEWTPDKIDFYVDDQKYFTYKNESSGYATWPFDQPFYIILNLAVGGGWVGNPDAGSVFPAVMDVDYVRVYQYLNDVAMFGDDFVLYNSQNISYSVPDIEGASYEWSVPGNAQIVSGLNTHQIDVDWDVLGGDLSIVITTKEGSYEIKYPVNVSSNYFKNAGFEKGVKYWNSTTFYPYEAAFSLNTSDVHCGQYSLFVDVAKPGTNTWDVSLSKRDFIPEAGKKYTISFWAKSAAGGNTINAAVIKSSDYSIYTIKTITLTGSWAQYNLDFTAPSNAKASFNIDMGDHIGSYFFDDFVFTTPELSKMNLVNNADFSEGIEPWILNAWWPGLAIDAVQNGECAVSIDNAGTNTWDINLGQSGFPIENGKIYDVSFDAYASDPRQIIAFVGKNSDPWTFYSGSHVFSLTTTKQTFSYSFTMKEPTDLQSRLGFDIGASLPDVFFDNVILSEHKTTTDLDNDVNPGQETFKLHQNYPNPFNPGTQISYSIPLFDLISLKVYDLFGKEIETLVNEVKAAGSYIVYFDASYLTPGMYIYTLRAGIFTETEKMIIIK